MSALDRRILLAALAMSALLGVVIGELARGTGVAAITLLLASLGASPLALVVSPPLAVALRAARRRLGIASALVAIVHACVALPAYLDPPTIAPIAVLPWLRHGALALTILVALLVTSFPTLQRALRVRAWSALHRLAYAAAVLASLHALAVPFGSAKIGLAALVVTAFLLVARPIAQRIRGRRHADRGPDAPVP